MTPPEQLVCFLPTAPPCLARAASPDCFLISCPVPPPSPPGVHWFRRSPELWAVVPSSTETGSLSNRAFWRKCHSGRFRPSRRCPCGHLALGPAGGAGVFCLHPGSHVCIADRPLKGVFHVPEIRKVCRYFKGYLSDLLLNSFTDTKFLLISPSYFICALSLAHITHHLHQGQQATACFGQSSPVGTQPCPFENVLSLLLPRSVAELRSHREDQLSHKPGVVTVSPFRSPSSRRAPL